MKYSKFYISPKNINRSLTPLSYVSVTITDWGIETAPSPPYYSKWKQFRLPAHPEHISKVDRINNLDKKIIVFRLFLLC